MRLLAKHSKRDVAVAMEAALANSKRSMDEWVASGCNERLERRHDRLFRHWVRLRNLYEGCSPWTADSFMASIDSTLSV